MLALGADHAGWQLEKEIKAWLLERNAELLDSGTHSPDPVDYPDYAAQVAEAVAAANKVAELEHRHAQAREA
jgi:ribose 5-phosphate isomerase B